MLGSTGEVAKGRIPWTSSLASDDGTPSRISELALSPARAAAMGVPASLRTARVSLSFELVRPLTAEESANGFEVEVHAGLSAPDLTQYEQSGARLRVEPVTILGQ